MIKVKNLSVTVTYRVGYGDVEMPQEVYDQLVQAEAEGHEICSTGMVKFPEAAEWLTDNIKQKWCTDCRTSIDEITK